MATEEFKQKLRERLWKIEGVMNELKNYHCLLKAKYRGIDNAQIQAYMAATAINIKRLVNLLLALSRWIILIKSRPPFTTGRYLFITNGALIPRPFRRY
ncbi:MAG: transposase [Legionella sp.]|nr:transposase [Legionella sp.]